MTVANCSPRTWSSTNLERWVCVWDSGMTVGPTMVLGGRWERETMPCNKEKRVALAWPTSPRAWRHGARRYKLHPRRQLSGARRVHASSDNRSRRASREQCPYPNLRHACKLQTLGQTSRWGGGLRHRKTTVRKVNGLVETQLRAGLDGAPVIQACAAAVAASTNLPQSSQFSKAPN